MKYLQVTIVAVGLLTTGCAGFPEYSPGQARPTRNVSARRTPEVQVVRRGPTAPAGSLAVVLPGPNVPPSTHVQPPVAPGRVAGQQFAPPTHRPSHATASHVQPEGHTAGLRQAPTPRDFAQRPAPPKAEIKKPTSGPRVVKRRLAAASRALREKKTAEKWSLPVPRYSPPAVNSNFGIPAGTTASYLEKAEEKPVTEEVEEELHIADVEPSTRPQQPADAFEQLLGSKRFGETRSTLSPSPATARWVAVERVTPMVEKTSLEQEESHLTVEKEAYLEEEKVEERRTDHDGPVVVEREVVEKKTVPVERRHRRPTTVKLQIEPKAKRSLSTVRIVPRDRRGASSRRRPGQDDRPSRPALNEI